MASLFPCRLLTPAVEPSLRLWLAAARAEMLKSPTARRHTAFHARSEASMITCSAPRLFPGAAGISGGTEPVGNFPSNPLQAAQNGLSPGRRGVGGGPLHPESADPFQPQPRRRMDLKVGPYKGGRLFVSPREDPKEFILCVIIVAIFLYTLITTYTQPGGETVIQRKRRIIKERLMKEAGITQADLDELDAEEAPLSS